MVKLKCLNAKCPSFAWNIDFCACFCFSFLMSFIYSFINFVLYDQLLKKVIFDTKKEEKIEFHMEVWDICLPQCILICIHTRSEGSWLIHTHSMSTNTWILLSMQHIEKSFLFFSKYRVLYPYSNTLSLLHNDSCVFFLLCLILSHKRICACLLALFIVG